MPRPWEKRIFLLYMVMAQIIAIILILLGKLPTSNIVIKTLKYRSCLCRDESVSEKDESQETAQNTVSSVSQ